MLFRPPILTVEREAFRLRLWKPGFHRYWIRKEYEIAVGSDAHETRPGMYFIEGKTKTPGWLAPDADWVPLEDRGKIFPYDDPKNPFAGAFISISTLDGIGFHGTKFPPQLGERVSHGCVRMAVEDVLDLYPRVELGTPVFIY